MGHTMANIEADHGPCVAGSELSDPRRTVAVMALDIPRLDGRFQVVSDFQPSGDQPTAIDELERRVRRGDRHTVLLGATGTGKSATTAWLVERLQRPTLVLAPNKTLCAQLAKEFRELLPHNAVEYFVSYYDYYQPEAYIPQTDTYIEKDSSINEEVERLRHSATMSLLTRRDVIVVATVSAIYGLGTPEEYLDRAVRVAGRRRRSSATSCCAGWSTSSTPATTWPSTGAPSGSAATRWRSSRRTRSWRVRIEFFGDEVEKLYYLHPLTGDVVREVDQLLIFPATHYAAGPERMERAIRGIEAELARAAGRAGAAGQAAGGAAAADAHHLRHRDDAPGRLLLRHRELLDAHRRPASPAARRTACSTTSPTTSSP